MKIITISTYVWLVCLILASIILYFNPNPYTGLEVGLFIGILIGDIVRNIKNKQDYEKERIIKNKQYYEKEK